MVGVCLENPILLEKQNNGKHAAVGRYKERSIANWRKEKQTKAHERLQPQSKGASTI